MPTDDPGRTPLEGESGAPAESGGSQDLHEPVAVADSLMALRQSAVVVWTEYGRYLVWASVGAALGALNMTLYVLAWSPHGPLEMLVDAFSNPRIVWGDGGLALGAGYGAFIGASLGLLLARLVRR